MTFIPRTWVTGETVSEATMNTEIRDQFNSMFAAWSAYTPVWTANIDPPAIGNGTLTGRYIKIGRRCDVAMKLTPGSTTTFGNGGFLFSLPFPAALAGVEYVGKAWYTGASGWVGAAVTNSAGTLFNPIFPSASANTVLPQTRTNPEAIASGHNLRMFLTYQTAS